MSRGTWPLAGANGSARPSKCSGGIGRTPPPSTPSTPNRHGPGMPIWRATPSPPGTRVLGCTPPFSSPSPPPPLFGVEHHRVSIPVDVVDHRHVDDIKDFKQWGHAFQSGFISVDWMDKLQDEYGELYTVFVPITRMDICFVSCGIFLCLPRAERNQRFLFVKNESIKFCCSGGFSNVPDVMEASVLFISTVFHVRSASCRCLYLGFRAPCAARVTRVTCSKRSLLGVPLELE